MSCLLARSFLTLFVVPLLAYAQAQPLPSEIKGRWTYQGRVANTFTLSEIKGAADKTFTAKLDWRTANSACAIQGDAVSGKVTDKGIAWEFVTKSPCNTPYTAELNRGDKGWEGKVAAKDNSVVADIKADLAMASPLHTTGQPPEIILVNMGGNDCPPCVSWRMFELPKLQATEAFRSITFVHVEKSIKSTVPPPLLPPIGG